MINYQYFNFPPMATDFSAVASALYNFNSFDLIYSPGCCYTSLREVDEYRDLSENHLYTTKLKDTDIINSGIQSILRDLKKEDLKNFDFISIIGTFATDATGVNLKSEAREIKKETNKKTIFFKCNGFNSYSSGVKEALNILGRHCLDKSKHKRADHEKKIINVLGYHPMIHGNKTHLNHLEEYLSNDEVEIMFFGIPQKGKKDINLYPESIINIVISQEAEDLAIFMEKEYGVPYLLKLPFGINGMLELLKDITRITGLNYATKIRELEVSKKTLDFKKEIDEKIVIFGEPFVILAVEEMFKLDFKAKNISLICNFSKKGKDGRLFSGKKYEKILFTKDENIIIEKIADGDLIIADPLCKDFKKSNSKFISLPYPGLSGREYIGETPGMIGEYSFIKNMIKKRGRKNEYQIL